MVWRRRAWRPMQVSPTSKRSRLHRGWRIHVIWFGSSPRLIHCDLVWPWLGLGVLWLLVLVLSSVWCLWGLVGVNCVSLTCIRSVLTWILSLASCLEGLSWIEFGLDWFRSRQIWLELYLGLGWFDLCLPWFALILVSGVFGSGVWPIHKSLAHAQAQQD